MAKNTGRPQHGRFAGLPLGLRLVNFLVQRVLRVNHAVRWMVHFTSRVSGDVRIGRGVWRSFAVSGGCYIQGHNGIRIGDGTIFAPHVCMISANHDLARGGYAPAPPIVIGRHCWIGTHAVILPGVSLGDGVTVGAGAVVTRSFPAGSVLVGVPARPIQSGTQAHRRPSLAC